MAKVYTCVESTFFNGRLYRPGDPMTTDLPANKLPKNQRNGRSCFMALEVPKATAPKAKKAAAAKKADEKSDIDMDAWHGLADAAAVRDQAAQLLGLEIPKELDKTAALAMVAEYMGQADK